MLPSISPSLSSSLAPSLAPSLSLPTLPPLPPEEKSLPQTSREENTLSQITPLTPFQLFKKNITRTLLTLTRKTFAIPTPFDWSFVENTLSFSPLSASFETQYLPKWYKIAGRALTRIPPLLDNNEKWSRILLNASKGDLIPLINLLEQEQIKNQLNPSLFKRSHTQKHNTILTALSLLTLPVSPEKAVRYAPSFPNLEPDPHLLHLIPILILIKEKRHKEAITHLRSWRLHEKEQKNPRPLVLFIAHYKLSILYATHNLNKDAFSHAKSAANIAQDHSLLPPTALVTLWLQASSFALKTHNIRKGFSSCSQAQKHLIAIPEGELHMYAHHTLASLHALQKNWDKSVSHIKTAETIAIRLHKSHAHLSQLKALSHIATFRSQWDKALAITKKLRKYALALSQHALALSAGLHVAAIYKHLRLQKHEEDVLERLLPEAEKHNLSLVEILHTLAVNQIRQGTFDKATHTLNHASSLTITLKDNPEPFQTTCHLTALLNIRMNRITIADFWLERAKIIAKKPNNNLAAILSNTGYLRFRQGKKAVAFDKWKKAQHIYAMNNSPHKVAHMQKIIERLQREKPSVTVGTNLTDPGPLPSSSNTYPPYPLNTFVLS